VFVAILDVVGRLTLILVYPEIDTAIGQTFGEKGELSKGVIVV